jgi:FkbH-like protein
MTTPSLPPALAALREELRTRLAERGHDDAAYVEAADRLAAADLSSLPPLRLAILRSFTIDPVMDALAVQAFFDGWRLEPFFGQFNQFAQEILDPAGEFYRTAPQLTLLALRLEELDPAILEPWPADDTEPERRAGQLLQTLDTWLALIGQRTSSLVLLSNFLVPSVPPEGLAGTQQSSGVVARVRRLNDRLLELVGRHAHATLFDLELFAAEIGKARLCDPLQWHRMRNPFRLSAYPAYAGALMRHVRGALGRRRKCLVLDLDNTLWGGVLGEDGPTGVRLGEGYPGAAFTAMQRAIGRLRQRGVLLALCSKNDAEQALSVIRTHPGMALREDDFSVIRIGWHDKAESLVEIARTLNIALDALVFVDDSPVECSRVREALPQVEVVQLSGRPADYAELLERLPAFDQLRVTDEDRQRAGTYHVQAQREQLAASAGSLDAFYAGLGMRATLWRNECGHVARIAQMTQKTTQFNLTPQRYTEAQVLQWMAEGTVLTLRLEDRLGDNGIVAVAILRPTEEGDWLIDSLLMSCRVIMRTVEQTLLAEAAQLARQGGARRLIGRYAPTERNHIVAEFYPSHGFAICHRAPHGSYKAALELADGRLPSPSAWIAVTRTWPEEPLVMPSMVAV